MEKFFIVTEKSELRKDYIDYLENLKVTHEIAKKFMDTHNIKAKEYAPTNEVFYIVPSEEDIKNFDKMLGNELDNELRPFKKNSKVNKEWVNLLKEKNLKVLRKPFVPLYFNAYGKSRNRLFMENDVVYCSFEKEYDFETPKGLIEIKGSEFYKAVEE